MPSRDDSIALVREYIDDHGGTVVDITTADEYALKEKTVAPGLKPRVVKPDNNNEALAKVIVEAIPKAHISTLTIADGHLRCVLSKRKSYLKGILSLPTKHLTGTVIRSNHSPTYDGPYMIDPSARREIVLQTSGLVLNNDIVVNKIYYSEVSNLANGTTVYIAEH